MNELADKQERAESGRAGCKTKERPLRQIRAGDPSDDGTAPQPEAGAAERGKMYISSPAIIPKQRLGRKDVPGIFYFIGMKIPWQDTVEGEDVENWALSYGWEGRRNTRCGIFLKNIETLGRK